MRAGARRNAQVCHALTFALASFAVIFQLALVIRGHQHLGDAVPDIEAGGRPELSTRLARFCSYMTIWFNVLVAGTSAALAVDPTRDGRVWRALRLNGVVLAVGGGIVHWFLLRPLLDLHGPDYVADKLLHIVVPLVALLGWVVYGPRNRVDGTDLLGFLVVPVVWLAYTLIRGAIVNWYPYPFIDVNQHGYPAIAAISLALAALLLGLASGAMWLDRRLL